MCRGADQSADNRANCRRAERNPSGVTAVMDMVDDMMPGRRRRAMRTTPPVMRRGNRRTSRQNHPSHENRNCLDDLVHITPTFPDFLSLHKGREDHRQNLTKLLNRRARRPYLGSMREKRTPRSEERGVLFANNPERIT